MKTHYLILIAVILFPCMVTAQNGTWETGKSSIPIPMGAPVSQLVEGKIYIIGGFEMIDGNRNNGVATSRVQVYDPVSDDMGCGKQPVRPPSLSL